VSENQTLSEDFFWEFCRKIDVNLINRELNPWIREENMSDELRLFLKVR